MSVPAPTARSAWSAVLHTPPAASGFGLDVTVEGPAGVLCLAGPNGSGKTSVLRALLGARAVGTVATGRVVVNGVVWQDSAAGTWLDTAARHVGYVPQDGGLFAHLDVLDNVAFGLRARPPARGAPRVSRQAAREAAAALLDRMGCAHLAQRGAAGLSGGERARVALARALLPQPAMVLLDEPMAAMDAIARRDMRAFLAASLGPDAKDAPPAVLVTHDVADAAALGAQIAVLEAGRVVQQGALEDVRATPHTTFARAFTWG